MSDQPEAPVVREMETLAVVGRNRHGAGDVLLVTIPAIVGDDPFEQAARDSEILTQARAQEFEPLIVFGGSEQENLKRAVLALGLGREQALGNGTQEGENPTLPRVPSRGHDLPKEWLEASAVLAQMRSHDIAYEQGFEFIAGVTGLDPAVEWRITNWTGRTQVRGNRHANDKGGSRKIQRAWSESEADFHSVYAENSDGSWTWLADHLTAQRAVQHAERLELMKIMSEGNHSPEYIHAVVNAALSAERSLGAQAVQTGYPLHLIEDRRSLQSAIQSLQSMAYVQTLERLWEGLSEAVEAGRLRREDIPDDYDWLTERMNACAEAQAVVNGTEDAEISRSIHVVRQIVERYSDIAGEAQEYLAALDRRQELPSIAVPATGTQAVPEWEHTFSLDFSVSSQTPDASDVTPDHLRDALQQRINHLDAAGDLRWLEELRAPPGAKLRAPGDDLRDAMNKTPEPSMHPEPGMKP